LARFGESQSVSLVQTPRGVSQTTATEWLNLMEASYVLYRLKPWFANTGKRLVKRPKLYFYDTGVASFLLGLTAPDHVENHPLRGALFENSVINEVLKFDLHRDRMAELFFYRDSNGNEVDLLYRRGRILVPMEIKSGQTVNRDYFKGIAHFRGHFKANAGAAIYAGGEARERGGGHVLPCDEVPALLESLV